MARGWESKGVESQQADRESLDRSVQEMSPEDRDRRIRRGRLELDRSRVQAELAGASQPAHREMLERALRALDAQIASLER
jgi:hypothetical protein